MSALIGPWKPSARLQRRSAVRSGVLTGLAQIVLALAAAGAGALLAHRFGRTAETDGFLGAYAVYIVLVFAAQSFRMVVVPDLTRAAAAGRLGGETRAFGVAFLSLAVPVCVAVALLSSQLGDLLTGKLPPTRRARGRRARSSSSSRPRSASCSRRSPPVRSRRSTATARPLLGFALGGITGLVVFAAFSRTRIGVVALAWGLAANAVIALTVPVIGLHRRHALGGPWPDRLAIGCRSCGISSRAPRCPSRSRAATCSRSASPRISASAASRASRTRISPPRRSSAPPRSRSG